MWVGGDQAVEETGASGLILGGDAAGGQVAWIEDGGVCVVFVHCCGFLCLQSLVVYLGSWCNFGDGEDVIVGGRVGWTLCGGAEIKGKKREGYWRINHDAFPLTIGICCDSFLHLHTLVLPYSCYQLTSSNSFDLPRFLDVLAVVEHSWFVQSRHF